MSTLNGCLAKMQMDLAAAHDAARSLQNTLADMEARSSLPPPSRGGGWFVSGLVLGAAAMALGLLAVGVCHAKPGGDWSQVDPEVREWIGQLVMPDRSDNVSCCGEADAYEADLGETDEAGHNYAIITGTRGNPLPVGTKLLVPPEKIQNRQGNPSGHVIVFTNENKNVFCFVPNGGM